MKKTLTFLILFIGLMANAQITNRLIGTQNTSTGINPPNIMYTLPPNDNRIYQSVRDSLKLHTYQIYGIHDTIVNIGTTRYKPLSYVPAWPDITGKPTFFNGDYNNLTNKPDLSNYITNSSIGTLTNKSGNISMWTNNVGYLTSINSSMINSALGYTPYPTTNPNGYISTETDPTVATYIKDITTTEINNWNSATPSSRTLTINGTAYDLSANRSWTIPAQVNSDWNSVSGLSQILNKPTLSTVATSGSYNDLTDKPTIPTNNNQLTNGSGYITASSTNTLTNKSGNISQWTNDSNYLTSVPAQSFASLTGKPTTLSGYGITDAYPLVGNPSGFLTSITSSQITTALGFTPVSQAGARTAISLTTTGSGVATYNNSTGVLNVPTYSPPALTYNIPTRPLNTNYTISTTNSARVYYTVAITTSITLLNLNSAGRVFLEYSTNAGSTWTTINSAGVSKTLSVSISVGINETTYWNVTGEIPANALVRLRTTVAGGGTVTWDSGEETY